MDFEYPTWDHEKSIVPVDWETVSQRFEGWSPQTRAVVEVNPFTPMYHPDVLMICRQLLNIPDLATWSIWDSAPAETYTKNRVTMLGDAAHATTPFQGQGAGQAIEDALVITSLLAKVQSVNQIPNALMVYNQVRRPRGQRVVETSRESGRLLGMMLEGGGSDVQKMREHLKTRMHWIWHRDMVDQVREAEKLFEESL